MIQGKERVNAIVTNTYYGAGKGGGRQGSLAQITLTSGKRGGGRKGGNSVGGRPLFRGINTKKDPVIKKGVSNPGEGDTSQKGL